MPDTQDASAAGASVATMPIRAATNPAELAEPNTKLPRAGRTKNESSRDLVRIAVRSCEAATAAPGGCDLTPASLAAALAEPLEAMPPARAVWALGVSVAGVEATMHLPADVFSRDQAVEVAWRRIAIVAQRAQIQEG